MKATNIKWDTDGKSVKLPTEIELPYGMTDKDEISDYISDETGFCHKGFCVSDEGSFTAIAYEEDSIITADMAMFDTAEEAIEFAKSHKWDEVVNDISGEVIYKR